MITSGCYRNHLWYTLWKTEESAIWGKRDESINLLVVGSASLDDSEIGEEDDEEDVVVLGVSVVSVISVVSVGSTVLEVEVGVEAGVDVVVGGTEDDVVGVSWLVSFVSVGVGSEVSDSDSDDWVVVVGSSDDVVGVSEEVVVGGVEVARDSEEGEEEEVVSFTEPPCRTARRMMLVTILASLLYASPTAPSVRLRGT